MISIYLFDLDDTITDGQIYADIYTAILALLNEKSIDIDKEANALGIMKNKFGRYDSGSLCKSLGLLDEYYDILQKQIEVNKYLKDFVHDKFDALKKQGKTIGIVTNSMTKTISVYLREYHLKHFVDFTFSGDDIDSKKSQPVFWEKLISKHNLDPKDCLVIGDDQIEDVAIPQKSGFNTFQIKVAEDFQKII